MNFQQRCTVPASREELWDLLVDVPQVARCIPGVTQVDRLEGNGYKGTMNLQVGPIRLSLEGSVIIEEQDRDGWRASMRAEGMDRKVGGGLKAVLQMSLEENGPTATELVITTNVSFLGKLGEFGQPIIRRKADAILQEYARNLQARLSAVTPT